mgnify:CR=1 FL=1|jgi:hypothetical protein|tara:strand:- start:840 stop:1016 length:177 start_codon:yes stop_codon:yes gene_type:complete
MENLTEKEVTFITNEVAKPLNTLAALLEEKGVNDGIIREITGHLISRVRDMQNGKFHK